MQVLITEAGYRLEKQMNKRTATFMFGTAVLFLALSQLSQARAQLARPDRAFLKEASGMTRFQEESSRLAVDHARNLNVKVYAIALLKRHAAGDLAPLARSRGVTQPRMEGAHRKTLNQLTKARGAAFDSLYIQKVALQAQRDEAALLEQAAGNVQDPTLREWAQAMLPLVREQIAEAGGLAGGGAVLARKAGKTETKHKFVSAP